MALLDLVKRSELTGALSFSQVDGNWTAIENAVNLGTSLYQATGMHCSDLTTAITTGTTKGYVNFPYAITITGVYATVLTAPTGSGITIDINDNGTTILSTKLTIDAGEKTSATASTPAVISDSAIAANVDITIDFDVVGSTISGAGVIVWLIYNID